MRASLQPKLTVALRLTDEDYVMCGRQAALTHPFTRAALAPELYRLLAWPFSSLISRIRPLTLTVQPACILRETGPQRRETQRGIMDP
jgi:hypothetical protein